MTEDNAKKEFWMTTNTTRSNAAAAMGSRCSVQCHFPLRRGGDGNAAAYGNILLLGHDDDRLYRSSTGNAMSMGPSTLPVRHT